MVVLTNLLHHPWRPLKLERAFSFLRWVAGAIALGLLFACGGGGAPGDAPGAVQARRPAAQCTYEHVYVTVTRVSLRSDGGWTHTDLLQPRLVDLLEGSVLLQQIGVPPLGPGRYREVRLVLEEDKPEGPFGNVVLAPGVPRAPLQVPGGASGGIKVDILGDATVPPGRTGDLVLQGACESVMQAGHASAPRYILRPGVHATVVLGQPQASPAELMIPLEGGAILLPTRLPGLLVATYDAAVPVRRYVGNGLFAQEVVVPLLVNHADSPHGRLAQLDGGGFGGVWVSDGTLFPCEDWPGTASPTPCVRNAFTQAFTQAGIPIGAPLPLGPSRPYDVVHKPAAWPQVAPLIGGGYVVVWQKSSAAGENLGVWALRFSPDGTPAGAPHQVWAESYGYLRLTGLSHGGYAVVGDGRVAAFGPDDRPMWQATAAPYFYWGVVSPGDWRGEASLAALPGGGVVIAWNNLGHISVVQFGGNGSIVAGGASTTVDGGTGGGAWQSYPVVLALPDGGYVVGWIESNAMMARRFAANGVAAGPVTQVNVVTTYATDPTGAALLEDGRFLLSWGGFIGTGGRVDQWAREFGADALLGAP